MAMSQIEKDARKAATKVRDKAFKVRESEYKDAKKAMEAEINGSPESRAVNDSNSEYNLIRDRRDKAVAEIRQKIRELELEMEEVKRSHDVLASDANGRRQSAFRAHESLQREQKQALEARFHDLFGEDRSPLAWMSLTSWKIPSDVQAEMDSVYNEVMKQGGAQ